MSKTGKEKDVNSWKTVSAYNVNELSICVLLTPINHNIFPMFLQTWRDNKTKTSEKATKLRAARVQTGNKSVEVQLSQLDKKILGIIGYDFAEGVQSFDSFPEEQVIMS